MSYNPARNDTTIRRRKEIENQKKKQEEGSRRLMNIKYADIWKNDGKHNV